MYRYIHIYIYTDISQMPPDPAQPRPHPTHPSTINPHLLAHDIHALLFLLLQALSSRSSFLLDNALPQF